MTLYIFLAAWTFASVLVGLAAGRFIHTGDGVDADEVARVNRIRRIEAEDRIKSWQRDE